MQNSYTSLPSFLKTFPFVLCGAEDRLVGGGGGAFGMRSMKVHKLTCLVTPIQEKKKKKGNAFQCLPTGKKQIQPSAS